MRAESQPHHRDTPPEDVYFVEAGLLAHGSMLLSGLPETVSGLSDIFGQRLTAYSCGGSSGFGFNAAPASLFSFGPNEPEEPRRVQLRSTATSVNMDMAGRYERPASSLLG